MVAPFKHTHQLRQLRRLDPTAYQAAATALRAGLPVLAGQIAVNGMHRTLTRLTAPPACPERVQKPARARCDARHINPNPDGCKHIRCRKIARYTLVLRNTAGGAFYQVHRCQACRDELQARAAAPDAKFFILAESEAGR